ncbi:MAG: HAMP domain-containing histidine kinase [Rhodocyclales bacterium]|nr:HAMP domain-containing histidine kinase [Rhodocyclales bacterium]
MSLRYDSLRARLVWPFVLLGYVVSALLSLAAFTIVSSLEERAIERALFLELESFRYRSEHVPAALPPSASLLRGIQLPSPELPGVSPTARNKEVVDRVIIEDRRYSLLVADVEGRPYALIYDRTSVDAGLGRLALFLLVATASLTLLSYFVGDRLSRRLVQPIGQLLDDLTVKSGSADPRSGQLEFSVEDYPNNEIGELVRRIDAFAKRLQNFVIRENHFAADVSHELRTPVAVIRGAAEVLEAYPDLPLPCRQRLAAIQRSASRMGELLEAMLLLAREAEDGDDPACAVAEVIDDVVADCTPLLAGRQVRIQVDIRDNPILPVERSLAYVAISNLVRNACSYTTEGVIAISLESAFLEVSDTGSGIAEDRFPTLFERHTKGQESNGHGLGLSIVARVAQRLGWGIGLDSQSGKGTRVTVRFADI